MAKKTVYKGKIVGLSVHDIKVRGKKVRREIIEHGGASAILAFDKKDKVIMVKQHRYPHGYVLEIPAGMIERRESPRTCARRELLEETGYKAGKLSEIIDYYPSIGYNTEVIHCFLTHGATKVARINPDNDEFISVVKMDLNDLIVKILEGEIKDSKTICAVLAHIAEYPDTW